MLSCQKPIRCTKKVEVKVYGLVLLPNESGNTYENYVGTKRDAERLEEEFSDTVIKNNKWIITTMTCER